MRNRDIPNVVRQCLNDYCIPGEPKKLMQIANGAGIRVIQNTKVNTLRPNEWGMSYNDGSHWIVVYDDTQKLEERCFTVAHEFGHIFLKHREEFEREARRREKQADLFAACLLHSLQGDQS